MHEPAILGVTIAELIALALTGLACSIEIKTFRIPNSLNFGGLLTAIAVAAISGQWTLCIVGFVVGVVGGAVLYLTGAVGGGAVKLMLAVSALLGWSVAIVFFASGVIVLLTILILVKARLTTTDTGPSVPGSVIAAFSVLVAIGLRAEGLFQ